MYIRLLLFCVLLTPVLSSCNVRELAERFIPEAESEFARAHFNLYRLGEVDQIVSELSGSIVDDEIREKVEEIVDYVPDEEPISYEVVGSNTVSSGKARTVNLTIQYEYPDEWLLFSVSVDASSTPFKVNSVNAQLMEQSLGEINAFHLAQNGLTGILFVLFGVAVPVFCIAVFVVCLKTPIPRGKWRWAIFTLLGAMTFEINWTTGQTFFNPISVQLLGAGFARSGFYGPWVLSVAVPFGALVFLAKRRKWLSEAEPRES